MKPSAIHKAARAARHYGPTWRYLFNFTPTLSYRINGQRPSGQASCVLANLNRDGMAITSVNELSGAESCYGELAHAVSELELQQRSPLAEARRRADEAERIGEKTFVVQLLGEQPVFDPDSIYARFALQPAILQIANGYFGMYTRLRYYDVWHTLTSKSPARESQLWHRDREDHLILKMFVYFSDVDEGAGALTYAAGTHPKGHVRREPPYHLEGPVRRSSDEQMATVLDAQKWIKAVGPKGTIVFADTRGFHKGGLARERDRLMFVCMFTSQASQSKDLMRRRPVAIEARPKQKELAFALMA